MIDFEDALTLTLSESPRLSAKEAPITETIGRVLAETVIASINLPPYTKATIDGFAFYSEDAKNKKAIHEVIGSIAAGTFPKEKLDRGQAMEIQAEAPLPKGSDTVVPMDAVRLIMNGARVGMLKRVRKGKNIVHAGENLKKDEEILKAGICLKAVDLCLLTAAGIANVKVFSPPRVGILTIGNEFVEVGKKIKRGQIWDSNGIALLSALYEMGTQPEYLGTVAENNNAIVSSISRAKSCNVLIIAGITSARRHKLLMDVFNKSRIELLFDRVAIEPSSSVALAKFGQTLIFVLPQNPFFSMILFEVLITPVLRKMMGYEKKYHSVVDAILEKTIKKGTDYHLIQPANLFYHKNKIFIKPFSLDKTDIFSYAKCNALISVSKNVKSIKSGKTVEAIIIKQI